MAKGKDLPAVDFHAVIARRDPALAERLTREGLAPVAAPVLSVVPETTPPDDGSSEVIAAVSFVPNEETPNVETAARARRGARRGERAEAPPARRRGIVPRSNGGEAGRVTVYVPTELALRLRKYCFEQDRTISDVAGELLIEVLEKKLR